MHLKHQLAFDDVLRGAEAFGVLDNGFSGGVVEVHEVGYIADGPLHYPIAIALRRDKKKGDLFAKVGDQTGTLHQLQLPGSVVFFSGVVAVALPGVILVLALAGV